jgi:hypothetical protein
MPAVLNEVLVLSYFGTPDHPRMSGGPFSYPLPKPGHNIWNLCLYSEPLTVPGMDHSKLLTGMFVVKQYPSGPIDIKGFLTTNRLDRPADTAPNVGVSQTELMTLVELGLPPGNTVPMSKPMEATKGDIFGLPPAVNCGEPGGCGQTIVCPGSMLKS